MDARLNKGDGGGGGGGWGGGDKCMLVVDANLDMRYMYRGGSRILKGGGSFYCCG